MRYDGFPVLCANSQALIWVSETAIKASSVDRVFSMGKLVKRLGEFVAGDYETATPRIGPEPLSSVIASDLQIFQAATRELAKRKKENAEREQEDMKPLLLKELNSSRRIARTVKRRRPKMGVAFAATKGDGKLNAFLRCLTNLKRQ